MKIYVASSWRNQYQNLIVELLRSERHEVYDFKNPGEGKRWFSWSEIDEDWKHWSNPEYREALKHPIAQAGFDSDYNAMCEADACVLVLPCGKSAHTEAGVMAGTGKPVIVFMPEEQEPELMYKCFTAICTHAKELTDIVHALGKERRNASLTNGSYSFMQFEGGSVSALTLDGIGNETQK